MQSHFITGTHGPLSLPDLPLWHDQSARSWHAELTREQTGVHQADPYIRPQLHFAALVAGREAPLCSALDGPRTLQSTLAVTEAARSGPAVPSVG